MIKRKTKRNRSCETLNTNEKISIDNAIKHLKTAPSTKFDQSVDVSINTSVDTKQSDQIVRDVTTLPHGTGKQIRILALCKGDNQKAAKDAGATYFGDDEYIKKIQSGWTDFDVLVVTPDMMRDVGKLGKILGPRGLMPTPKAGTVTPKIGDAVTRLLAGQVEFRTNKMGQINNMIGKLSFSDDKLVENFNSFVDAIKKAKPAKVSGIKYIKTISVSSTMGPGFELTVE